MAATSLVVVRKGVFGAHDHGADCVPGYTSAATKWAVVQVTLGSIGGAGETLMDCDPADLLGWDTVIYGSLDTPVVEISNVPAFVYFAPTVVPYTKLSLIQQVSATTHKPDLATIQAQIDTIVVEAFFIGY
jgi:hypothetical protein